MKNYIYADTYSRLSREEENKFGESQSIENQKAIMRRYCEEHGIVIVREYSDDGFSGATFDRPAFKEMLNHLKTGAANVVITKDLSRLGRNMSEASYYAEQYFPENEILYITITDNFNSTEVSPMASFLFAYNDFYVRDTSKKIRSVLNVKRENGEYCCKAPFGYMKDSAKRGHLIPNPETAPVVQRVFGMVASGKSAYQTAKILTDELAPTPSVYNSNKIESPQWNANAVLRIIKNRVYLGDTILGKRRKASYKSQKVIYQPPDEWTVHTGTHTPLVTEEVFDSANRRIGANAPAQTPKDMKRVSIFRGRVFCSECGCAMCSTGARQYWYLGCNKNKNFGAVCNKPAHISYSELCDVVKRELNSMIDLSDDEIADICKKAVAQAGGSGDYCDTGESKSALEKKTNTLVRTMQKLYQDYSAGVISEELHVSLLENAKKEYEAVQTRLKNYEKQNAASNDVKEMYDRFFGMLKKVSHIDELTPDIISLFIDRIEIGQRYFDYNKKDYQQNIKIRYRFIGKDASEAV